MPALVYVAGGGLSKDLYNWTALTGVSIDAGLAPPLTGLQSIKIDENQAHSVFVNFTIADEKLDFTRRIGFGFYWRPDAQPTTEDFQICHLEMVGGAGGPFHVNLVRIRSGGNAGQLQWAATAIGVLEGRGSDIGSTGTIVLSNATWYRLWVDIPLATGTNNMTLTVYVDGIADAAATKANNSATIVTWYMGARTDTAVDASAHYAHIHSWKDITAEIAAVVMWAKPVANGTETQFTTINTGGDTFQFQAIDENPQNGAGAGDVDYIKGTSPGTGSKHSVFLMDNPARPANYNQPLGWGQTIWHRTDAAAPKYDNNKYPRFWFNGISRTFSANDGAAPNDQIPHYAANTAYGPNRRYFWEGATVGVNITTTELEHIETGISMPDSPNTEDWRISTIHLETLWGKDTIVAPSTDVPVQVGGGKGPVMRYQADHLRRATRGTVLEEYQRAGFRVIRNERERAGVR